MNYMSFRIRIQGKQPRLGLFAGTHGDEYEVIQSVEKAIEKYKQFLPDFVWIPEISPSAVARKTRFTDQEVDLNRSFRDGSHLAEVVQVQSALQDFRFDYIFSFHEDLELDAFYCYDSESIPPNGWDTFSLSMQGLGVEMMTGYDDILDPALACYFRHGYCDKPKNDPNIGALDGWLLAKGITKRAFTPEIPGKASRDMKDAIVDAFFSCFILPLCGPR